MPLPPLDPTEDYSGEFSTTILAHAAHLIEDLLAPQDDTVHYGVNIDGALFLEWNAKLSDLTTYYPTAMLPLLDEGLREAQKEKLAELAKADEVFSLSTSNKGILNTKKHTPHRQCYHWVEHPTNLFTNLWSTFDSTSWSFCSFYYRSLRVTQRMSNSLVARKKASLPRSYDYGTLFQFNGTGLLSIFCSILFTIITPTHLREQSSEQVWSKW